ncbi:hypothetical protein O6H91_06G053400 [Diphasiastrum complanatum]|uniref:Uncharacterized protein n=1 Tax=Diphasiastrum complanatum TaxID=34168 RepID=A0ACC2DE34_DIPCM|nr:hypothetical protein O6H91_06G053400 [Diphasiastrum complanatum]
MAIKKAVTRSSSSIVVPYQPTEPYGQFLSNFDQLYAGMWYMFNIYYFPSNTQCKSPQDLTASLKRSLSRVLVDYPVLAGRVRLDKDGRYEVFCNDAGAEVIEAFADARFDLWEDLKDCSLELELNPDDGVIADYKTAPLLKIQVTHFKCGGVALSLGWAHIVADGCAATGFLKSWGEIHRGMPISAPPTFDTTILKASGLPTKLEPLDDYISSPLDSNSTTLNNKIPETSTYQTLVFRFTHDSVEEILKEVESGPWSYGSATPFEAVSALVWKAMTEARNLSDNQPSKYIIPVNCRPRLRPPLSPTYFANAKHMTSAVALAGNLKARHFSYAAHVIHEKLKEVDSHLIRGVIDWMEQQIVEGCRIGFNADYYCGYDVQTASFLGFPCFQVDFGWGRPLHMSFPILPVFGDGLALLMPTAEEGLSTNVITSLPAHHMQKLLQDQAFVKYLPSFRMATADQTADHSAEDIDMAANPSSDEVVQLQHHNLPSLQD